MYIHTYALTAMLCGFYGGKF